MFNDRARGNIDKDLDTFKYIVFLPNKGNDEILNIFCPIMVGGKCLGWIRRYRRNRQKGISEELIIESVLFKILLIWISHLLAIFPVTGLKMTKKL
jgi:hypothetical protein